MDVRLSPEQDALRLSVARVVGDLGPKAVGELDDAARVDKLDAAVTDAGWRELRAGDVPDAPLASGVEAALVAEELARGLADVAFLGPTLAAELRRLAGVASVDVGESIGLDAGLRSLACVATAAFPHGLVAVDARGAERALVITPARQGHWIAQVTLPDAAERIDLTRPSVVLDGASPVTLVGGQATPIADEALDRWTALGIALSCADLVGVMRGATELTTAYAVERRQYGAPIGSFQAVQHLLADAHVLAEGSWSVALHAAWAIDALAPAEALHAAHVAKAYCARAARTVCETAVQVHGGIGNTWECLAHVYLRRALLSADLLGSVGASLDRVLAHHGVTKASGDDVGLR